MPISPEPKPPDWPTLAAQRWGPAVGDPTPGIIIEAPADDEAELLDAIGSAGFVAIDPASPRAPAWVRDSNLAVSMAVVHDSIDQDSGLSSANAYIDPRRQADLRPERTPA